MCPSIDYNDSNDIDMNGDLKNSFVSFGIGLIDSHTISQFN